MAILNHIHTIQRLDKERVRCGDPYCSFITTPMIVEGKVSLCNICGNEMILTRRDLKRYSRPRCVNCKKTKEALKFQEQQKTLQDILEKSGSE